MKQKQILNNIKKLERFRALLLEKVASNNKEFCKQHKYKMASFYALRRRLVMLGKIDRETFAVVNTQPITVDEYLGVPYPYGKRAKEWTQKKGKERHTEPPGVWMEPGVGKVRVVIPTSQQEKEVARELLKEPIELGIKDERDTITLSYDELVRIILAAKGVK